jgi:putative transposase
MMKEILSETIYNDNYGIERMQLALEQRGRHVGRRKVRKLMKENGWLHDPPRRAKGLTRVDKETQESENLIRQNFSATEPLKKLLTDISQIPCFDGKLYISPIMGCYNGEVLSLCMDNNMRKELAINTLKSAAARFALTGAILHSDRGSQYTSEAFREEMKKLGVIQSMSGVAHCYDNSRMESFFATLKKELLYRIPTYRMKMSEVKTIIFRYVFIYYNTQRVYTANPGGWPPVVYRQMTRTAVAA